MSDLEENTGARPGPWPWYVLLMTGHCLMGLFPWLMVLWAAFKRGNKRTALLGLIVNLAVYGLFSFYAVKARMPWWWLSSSFYVINLVWAMSAWIFQRIIVGGRPPARYIWSERSTWVSPFVIGFIIGVSLSIVTGIPGAMGERYRALAAEDILGRGSVLWIVLQNAYKGIPFGMLLGLWWAGEQRRFSVSHIITFLSAYFSTLLFMTGTGLFLIFLFTKGAVAANFLSHSPEWALTPPWATGLPKVLTIVSQYDLDLLVIPLLFGAVPRIRDYFKRLLWLPVVLSISLPFFYVDNAWWGVIQGRVFYDMSSSDERTRAAAYETADELLIRYPEHLHWPSIAEAVARYRYESGRFDAAKTLYQTVIQRFKGSNRWYWEVKGAEAALGSTGFGDPGCVSRIDIPVIGYESYLTSNWMGLLSVIRYWEGPQSPESNVTIKLKSLSKSDDKIQLNPLVTIADLDDAVKTLNYEMAILPSSLAELKALISAGIPVILVDKEMFRVVYGFDGGRSAVLFYGFESLSEQTRQEGRGEAKEILALKAEGHGESKERLDRIGREATGEYAVSAWDAIKYRAPYMVAIYPRSKAQALADAVQQPLDSITAATRGYLSAFIGLEFLRHADPAQAFEWAKIGSRLVSSPFPLYVGELSRLYWESREKIVGTILPFQDQFPELKETELTFGAAENRSFLENARHRFENDFKEGALPYFLLDALKTTLVSSDPDDQEMLIKLGHARVALDPSDADGWKTMAGAYEHTQNLPGMITALEGLTTLEPLNFNAKIDLAYALVLQGEYGKAESALKEIDPEKVKYNGDYPFCLGVVAERNNNPKMALEYYEEAIEMRRYKAVYHLHYGRLLLAGGRKEEAAKALRWAATIDAEGSIKKQAELLLSQIPNLS